MSEKIKRRLEYLRGELRLERLSWGEIHELQSLVAHIDPSDTELLEAAGAEEFPEDAVEQIRTTIVTELDRLQSLVDSTGHRADCPSRHKGECLCWRNKALQLLEARDLFAD